MNILLNAYEYWRYENINKQTFQQIDLNSEQTGRVTGGVRHSTSVSNSQRKSVYGS